MHRYRNRSVALGRNDRWPLPPWELMRRVPDITPEFCLYHDPLFEKVAKTIFPPLPRAKCIRWRDAWGSTTNYAAQPVIASAPRIYKNYLQFLSATPNFMNWTISPQIAGAQARTYFLGLEYLTYPAAAQIYSSWQSAAGLEFLGHMQTGGVYYYVYRNTLSWNFTPINPVAGKQYQIWETAPGLNQNRMEVNGASGIYNNADGTTYAMDSTIWGRIGMDNPGNWPADMGLKWYAVYSGKSAAATAYLAALGARLLA